MEIGATNVSALLGPYVPAIATATERFSIPYLILDPTQHGIHKAENLISVMPAPGDILKLTGNLLQHLDWTNVAVIYDSSEGNSSTMGSNYSAVAFLNWYECLSFSGGLS